MSQGISRRALLGTGAGAFAAVPVSAAGGGQTPAAQPSAGAEMPALNRFPRMVQEYFVARVRQAQRRGLDAKAALRTKADAEAYVRTVRDKARNCFGPMPAKTPLNARVTGVVERDAYNIEKVIFESRRGFLVTANLYVPKGTRPPAPGVIGSCGHSDNGKAGETYQAFAQGLARLGYVVLIFDPISQGERFQYTGDDLKSRIGAGVAEHNLAGNQQFLTGDFFGAWRAWDGIRALDYLLTRKEVDPRHVGITGNSGGGTMTTWLCALDDRWTMAAPGCFVTTFRRNMENELPADTEQCPPRAIALGLDHEDFIAALAPKPVILLAKDGDYFDVRGTQEAFGRLQRLYGLLGAPDNISMFVGHGQHGYTKESREAMYRWFNRATRVSDATTEPELVFEKDETLWCTPRGQVAAMRSRTVFSFTRDRAAQLESGRRAPARLGDAIAQALRLPPRTGTPDFRILRAIPARSYPKKRFTTYAIETEPGIHAIVYRLSDEQVYSQPPRDGGPAILYVPHLSSDRELREERLIAELIQAEPDATVYCCDVRGTGESQPDTCGADSFRRPYGSDYFYSMHGIMLGEPYVGRKTHDILRVLDWMAEYGHKRVHVAAKGRGAAPATFAAVLSQNVVRVTLKNAPTSFGEIAKAETYGWPVSMFVPGVLASFDLPDCYRALERKELRQIEPLGAAGLPV